MQHSLSSFQTANPAMEPAEELHADPDEPPEGKPQNISIRSQLSTAFGKADPGLASRRESLLTRQLHSEAEQTDDEFAHAPPRALSTQSTWSNPSVASTELTSDDGHSIASPAMSPPLPPTALKPLIPTGEKSLAREPQIFGQDNHSTETGSEKSVEAGLGRKRCISFACGGNAKKAPTSQPAVPPPTKEAESQSSISPPKRKCTLKFVCPTRARVEGKPWEKPFSSTRRHASPPPPDRKLTKSEMLKTHRGSDSTVTHASPESVRKGAAPAAVTGVPSPTTPIANLVSRRKLSNDSDASTEATRFHEFASSDDEPEEWVQESTCHRSRLTVSDTLQKENILRKACSEVEEEVVAEEDEDEDEEDGLDETNDGDDQDDLDESEAEESDDGFKTDDEGGFAESDSDGEGSDEDWWRPGGVSTAATSIDHLDRFFSSQPQVATAPSSSLGSASSGVTSPKGSPSRSRRTRHKHALAIHTRPEPVDLPDSTDFVCGTLDEDRPLEQAFINQRKLKEAAKHKARPQDIDPTFPTSDPEMDEEDDEDLEDPEDPEDPEESQKEVLMHGELDELDGDLTVRHRPAIRPRVKSILSRSPAPPARRRSPAPAALKRQLTARSSPPSRRNTSRSPPSPPPRKLFGNSPKRSRSPAPPRVMQSPPNTLRLSPFLVNAKTITPDVLARRPQLTYTASLPRPAFIDGPFSHLRFDDKETSEAVGSHAAGDIPKRGAIDIYKGLEKKRQRRKEKLYQKACAKAAAKAEKIYKVKPGRGAERMREVGLELQRYHGKDAHILSM